jgi:hypothetical protein
VAEIDRIYATANEEEHAIRGDLFMAGRWSCPRGCNPTTGQRFHHSSSLQCDIGMDGYYRFECGCGFEDLLTWAQVSEALAEHKSGTYS